MSWEQHRQDGIPGLPTCLSRDHLWVAVLAPRREPASVASSAVAAPLWPGSDLLPSLSSLAGLAHRGGSFISLQTCFSLFGLVYQERVFLEPLFPSQTVGERCLVCVSSPTKRPAWGPGLVTLFSGGWAGVPLTNRSNVSFVPPNTLSPWAEDKEPGFLPWILEGDGDPGISGFTVLFQTTLLTSCILSYKSPMSLSR